MSKFIQNIFSVKNELGHKVWTIFGIKIKYKYIKNKNKILIYKKNGSIKTVKKVKGLDVKFEGNNNLIEIYEPFLFNDCSITLNENSTAKFESTIYKYNKTNINASFCPGFSLRIGKNTSIGSLDLICVGIRDIKCIIGANCAFSTGILIQAQDGHFIVNKDTNEILNNPNKESINIGEHCWIGRNVQILKNVHLKNDTVVALGSVLTKSCEESNVVLAGCPAVVRKTNINWIR